MQKFLLYELFLPIYLVYQYIYCTTSQVSTKLIQAVLKTDWNNVIGNMYNNFFLKFKHFNKKYEMWHHIIFNGLIVSYLKIFLVDPIYLIVR